MILHLPSGSPLALRAAADLALVLHIGGGTLGMISGSAAMVLKKGGRLHRLAGNIFFGAMVTMAVVGSAVSPLIHQPVNLFGGLLALYLVITGWTAVRQAKAGISRVEIAAVSMPMGLAAGIMIISVAQMRGQTDLLDGVPAPAPYILASIAGLAGALDLRVILKRGIVGGQRLARHLWRLCAALLIADVSFFLGQPQVFPLGLRGSSILFLPEIFTLGIMIYWLVRVRRKPR